MVGFIELHDLNNDPYILNMLIIESIAVSKDGCTVIYPINQREVAYYKAKEPYEEIKYRLREVLA